MSVVTENERIVESTTITLDEVEAHFWQQLRTQRLYPGAALAVYHQGRLALHVVGGHADTQHGTLVDARTLFPLFSGSKPFAAVALWQQIERGRFELDDPVAAYWPAFGQNGKDQVLIRHILSHRGGFPTTPTSLPQKRWGDWDAAIRAIETMPLSYRPGTVSAYHFVTQHWVCAELVRRLDGRSYQDYLRAEITEPLGMTDTYVGLPLQEEHRVARLHATDGTDDWGRDVLRSMAELGLHRMVVPGASGVSTAADMARFYAALAAGGAIGDVRILRSETVARMATIEVADEIDPTFDVRVRRGLGIELGGLDEPKRHWPGVTSTVRTIWHGGFGSSVCWGDCGTGLAMAFLTNGIRRDEVGAVARRDLSDAVRVWSRDGLDGC